MNNKFFKDEKLNFLECRYSNTSKKYKQHFHESFSMGIILNKKRVYTNKNKSYEIDDKTVVFVNPYEIHSCNPIEKESTSYYMIYLDKKWCFEIQKSIFEDLDEFLLFPHELIKDEKLYKEFKNLCELLLSDEFYLEKECVLVEFLTKLYKKVYKTLRNKKQIQSKKIKKILEYLNTNIKEDITLEELSKEFNLSTFYIIRLFKKELNTSPYSYFLNLKINLAKKLLQKNYTIVDTALECGFYDQSHFHRNFVKIVASTPKDYQVNFVQ